MGKNCLFFHLDCEFIFFYFLCLKTDFRYIIIIYVLKDYFDFFIKYHFEFCFYFLIFLFPISVLNMNNFIIIFMGFFVYNYDYFWMVIIIIIQ